MKHNIKNKKLNRTSSHRKAMFMNLSNALIKHEQITTTLPKAKELKRFIEKIITLSKKGDLLSRRKTISILQDLKMVKKTFDVLADRYKDRNGGYTRVIKLGNRFGDNAPTAVIELVDRDFQAKKIDIKKKTEEKSKTPIETKSKDTEKKIKTKK